NAAAGSRMKAHGISRRSIRAATAVASGAETAATGPGMAIVSPAIPSETVKSAPIDVSRPIGRISAVTMAKIPIITETTADQALNGGRPAGPGLSAEYAVVLDMDVRSVSGAHASRAPAGPSRAPAERRREPDANGHPARCPGPGRPVPSPRPPRRPGAPRGKRPALGGRRPGRLSLPVWTSSTSCCGTFGAEVR